MGDRTCSNCSHCKRAPGPTGEVRVRCVRGMWTCPDIDALWLEKYRYLPLDKPSGLPLAVLCPMFEAGD